MEHNKFAKYVRAGMLGYVLVSAVVFFSGCRSGLGPRLRVCAFFGSPTGMSFPDPQSLGKHNYVTGTDEINGMVYTCKAGFIDIGHVREAADRTGYLIELTYKKIMRNETEFSFTVIEPSQYFVKLEYPRNWNHLSAQQRLNIAIETSIALGQYFAHTSLIWHEILTWYGFSSFGIFPENISAFSWEDSYSDVLGTYIAATAMRENQLPFDDAVTKLINTQLEALDVQSPDVARKAVKKIRGEWFTGGLYFLVNMKKRNFDVGFDDGWITPALVPDACDFTFPKPWPVPNINVAVWNGFKMSLEIEPRTKQQGSIYHAINLDRADGRIQPKIHFPEIIELIQHPKSTTQ